MIAVDSPIFDFSKAEPPIPDDIVVRTWVGDDVWIDVLVTPSGNEALWNFSPTISTCEEAKRLWLTTKQ